MIRSQIEAIRWIAAHPLNRGRREAALLRWATAQVRSHLTKAPRLVPFIDGTRLHVGRGLTTANMQHYAGLGEPDVMGFLMHYIRPDDVVADVGANVGVMTVLAAGVGGAKVIAFEPDSKSFSWLERNVAANELQSGVRRVACAVGAEKGEIRLTVGLGAANHAASPTEEGGQVVACDTLDRLLAEDHPTVIKADVEGFELPMLRGAQAVLRDPRLRAVVLELKNHGARYGFEDKDVRAMMSDMGFAPYTYDPFERRLIHFADCTRRPPNTIFLRDPAAAAERLRTAPKRQVIWGRSV